jgi:predicted  nucleic acid-binding Zn ribbon protein
MILYKLTFGAVTKATRDDAVSVAEDYVSVLCHNGQACGEYFLVYNNGKLCIYLHVAGIHAHSRKYHSKHGVDRLSKVIAHFGAAPQWELAEDDVPKRDTTWAKAPFLYLFADDWESPLRRGDSGKPIPLYRLPGVHNDREAIYFWQHTYHSCDLIWMLSGELETSSYKQLAATDSELSRDGRATCRYVEKVTGIPTYYYLMRHWGRRRNEEARKCPGCGRAWRTTHPINPEGTFSHFTFKCDKCRLVSLMANVDYDERRALVGEWKKPKKKLT